MEHLLAQGSPETLCLYLDLPRLLLDDEDYLGLELVGQRQWEAVCACSGSPDKAWRLGGCGGNGQLAPRKVSFRGCWIDREGVLGWRAVGSQLSLPTVVEVWGRTSCEKNAFGRNRAFSGFFKRTFPHQDALTAVRSIIRFGALRTVCLLDSSAR